jgi:hypothetical protein
MKLLKFFFSAADTSCISGNRYAPSSAPVSKFGPGQAKFGARSSKFGLFFLNSVVFGPGTERQLAGILAPFAKRTQVVSKFGLSATSSGPFFFFSCGVRS